MIEIWKPVKGFEDEYEVSNLGRVRSFDRVQRRSNGRVMCDFKIKGQMLKPFKAGKADGYFTVSIHGKSYKVHRLVAAAFIPNPCNLPQVNHIDGDKKRVRAKRSRKRRKNSCKEIRSFKFNYEEYFV